MKEYLPEIKRLRKQRWTYREIGEKLGFSKQRVHQIYKKYMGSSPWHNKKSSYQEIISLLGGICKVCGTLENLEIHHKDRTDNRIESLSLFCRKHHREEESRLYRIGIRDRNILNGSRGYYKSCSGCREEMWVVPSQESKNKFCSKVCLEQNRVRYTSEELREHKRIYTKSRYQNDPEFRRKQLESAVKYHQKVMADPDKREHFNGLAREAYYRRKQPVDNLLA